MALNTKIQFRRGYSAGYSSEADLINNRPIDENNTWKEDDTLAEGEIGYEVDTGKFKIGKYINGSAAPWASLPYAGGSALTAENGIALKLDQADNAYSIYSYITGVAGGQEGITFSVHPASEILTEEDGEVITGTYYQIALSDKLENFHDSNISISDNLISSSTDGITVSGLNNSTISLNPDGGTVEHSGVNIRNLFLPTNTNITVTENVGGLTKGTVLTNASGIVDVLQTLLEKVFEPNVDPSPSLSPSVSPIAHNTNTEAGTISNLIITANFNQGIVRGTGLGADWVSNGNQGVRAGAATQYTINGTNNGTTSSLTLSNYEVVDGANNFPISVNHATGIVPKNSLGNNSTTLGQLTAGTLNNTATVNGRRNLFYGALSTVNDPPTATTIRNLSAILNPSLTTQFQLTAPINTRTMIVAVPSGANYGSVANGNFSALDNNTNLMITNSFQSISVSVPGANNYNPIVYKVWYYINGAPSPEPSTYTINLN
jgi:hypothetical protein